MVPKQIKSNAFRGDYMHDIVDRTINEIHDELHTVFGPFAQDAYLTMNGQPYYTRDGKETIRLMRFDNELSMYILKLMYQAVAQQGEKVGDGTTTLAMLYTNLYKRVRKKLVDLDAEDVCFNRKIWNEIITWINTKIKAMAVPLTETDLLQMLFTCTQDDELSAKIYTNLRKPIMEKAFITINKSNVDNDFVVTTHENPTFEVTKQYSIFPVKPREERCTILHCNGMLDLTHAEVILDLMSRIPVDGYPMTVILLCNGITEATRRTLKDVNRNLNMIAKDKNINEVFKDYNNVAIYTLTKYRSYDAEQLEDISTIITDENGIGGLVNQLTFESMLHQAFGNPEAPIEELQTFDCDAALLDKMKTIFCNPYAIEFDEIKGMRLFKHLGPVASARYQQLIKDIDDEKSGVKRVELVKRLRTMYGQFIDVEVGSKLLKDSQRKYELILDAVLSASEGVEKGVLHTNSLFIAHKAAMEVNDELITAAIADSTYIEYIDVLLCAIEETLNDLVDNGFVVRLESGDHFGYTSWYDKPGLECFNLNVDLFTKIIPDTIVEREKHTVTVNGEELSFEERIIEPVSIITTMLENSSLVMELAHARAFQLEGFMENYI